MYEVSVFCLQHAGRTSTVVRADTVSPLLGCATVATTAATGVTSFLVVSK